MYQKEWFGIRFGLLGPVSIRTATDAVFYERFYRAFFRRYRNWSELARPWIDCKSAVAACLRQIVRDDGARSVLSVGCGLGWIERSLVELDGSLGLEVTEGADSALQWIRDVIPPSRIHVGGFPECVPPDRRYDLVYTVAYDYALDADQLVQFIRAARSRLAPRGRFVMVSVTFDDASDLVRRVRRTLRALVVRGLDVRPRSNPWQFWGWYRTREEYRSAMRAAGFEQVQDGFVENGEYMGQPSYFIAART